MKEYKIGDIVGLNEYKDASIWCRSNNATMEEIEKIDNNRRFEIVSIPKPTFEDIDQARIQYRKEHIDDKTIARMRKMANETWTDKDEQAYLELDAEVTAWIEENLSYPEE